jgi:molybdopterin converting factor small subunit
VGVLAERPGLRRLQVRFAVNESYVDPDRVLQDGDEVAVFPPVSGGC